MTESPYAIPLEDLVDSARVPEAQQVVEQPERRSYAADWSSGAVLGGDDGGDCD
jgi:hypothetical protein